MELGSRDVWGTKNCPPESGGQRGRIATTRGVVPQAATLTVGGLGTTPALRAIPLFSSLLRPVGLAFAAAHDSGREFISSPASGFLAHVA